MYPQERQDEILAILEKFQYVTVAYLIEKLRYSSATINRDLNVLEKRKLVRRSYGGVELVAASAVPLVFRQHKQHHAKEKIAQKAAEFVCDGDVIFVDGSTTAQHMGPFLTEKSDVMVITNNITLASYLSDLGIACVVLGGKILEAPSMIGSTDTVDMARSYRADKAFFSTGSVTDRGHVGCGGVYYDLHRVMMENSEQSFYLVDNEKRNRRVSKILCDFSSFDYVISDYDFSSLEESYPDTQIIQVTV
ncbi:MAG: DeoR/GlpR transcriptional regulator [Clostridia bacterium]|nr:DeoR/GlpR transcriptional regulator [Clostridia bacterium]